jgi:Cdc6-like AAA superfamily ATPase
MTVVIIMMILKTVMRKLILAVKKIGKWAEEDQKPTIGKLKQSAGETASEVQSVWDYLSFKENTQALHLSSTIGFEEWVEMPEVRRRIRELYNMDYKNERSLYPYVKTLVDSGLIESTDIGGKRKWRKKPMLLKLKQGATAAKPIEEKEAEKSE